MMPRDPEELNNEEPPVDPEAEGAPETDAPEKAVSEAEEKAAEYLASWQRAQADFINYKRRMEQERADYNRFANANFALALLPALDDLERAIAAVPHRYAKSEWVEGVRLVARKFLTILEGQGVKPVVALGQPFDPNFHEALRQAPGQEGVVIEEFQKGYMLNDKLLRPARVVVGNGEAENKEAT